jgi:hypothetical protein
MDSSETIDAETPISGRAHASAWGRVRGSDAKRCGERLISCRAAGVLENDHLRWLDVAAPFVADGSMTRAGFLAYLEQ